MKKNEPKRYATTEINLDRLYNINEKVGTNLFQRTFNDFLIMSGMSPDIPTGMRRGMVKERGVWRKGFLYSQHQYWEDNIDFIWDEFDREGFVFFTKNRLN